MRAVVIVIAIAGCGDNVSTRQDAAVHPAIDAPADAPDTCAVTGTCTTGPTCGASCCGDGEHCAAGVCMCGDQPACTDGNTCNGAGFVGVCGSVCCGTTIGCPI